MDRVARDAERYGTHFLPSRSSSPASTTDLRGARLLPHETSCVMAVYFRCDECTSRAVSNTARSCARLQTVFDAKNEPAREILFERRVAVCGLALHVYVRAQAKLGPLL